MKDLDKETLSALLAAVEKRLKMQPVTPREFNQVTETITQVVGTSVSPTTLMRVWGYVKENISPSRATLNILARFVGCTSFEHWRLTASDSDHPKGTRLDLNTLAVGDRLRLRWQTNRVVDVAYMGNRHFKVLHAVNTRLQSGDEFDCGLFVNGEALYLDNLDQNNGRPKGIYVCGRHHGVQFERIGKVGK